MVRCFIGIMLPRDLRQEIIKLQKTINQLPIKCKMVEPENFHISLSFLGEVDESKLKKIILELEDICEKFTKFEIMLKRLKFIPNKSFIRVLCLDAVGGETLTHLQKEIKVRIGGSVKPPHLTLCRVKKIEDKKKLIESLTGISLDVKFCVTAIDVVESQLKKSGPVYSIIKKIHLKPT